MTASPNEVQLILNAIQAVRSDVEGLRAGIADVKDDVATMDRRINGRIRELERFRWQLIGAAALLSAAGGMALRFVTL